MSRTLPVQEIQAGLAVAAGSILLAAPVGLLWAAVAPRVRVTVTAQGPEIQDVESNKAFIGADGSYFVIVLLAGVVCGLLAWRFFKRSGPTTVVALAVGGLVAALAAAAVGVMPGAHEAINAVSQGSSFRGTRDLYLGRYTPGGDASSNSLSLRAAWACVGWPAGALFAFLAMAIARPRELD